MRGKAFRVSRGRLRTSRLSTAGQRVQVDDGAVIFSERALLGHINLRGDPQDGRFITTVETTIGIGCPSRPIRRDALAGLFAAVTEVSGGQTVIVLRGRAEPTFEIIVRRSFADYVWR